MTHFHWINLRLKGLGRLFYPTRFNYHPQLGSKMVSPIHLKIALITAKIKLSGLASVTRINAVTRKVRKQVQFETLDGVPDFYLRSMCAGLPRTTSSEQVPRDFLINTEPGDPRRIGSNLRVAGKIIGVP
jgi:hypothetical protein